MEPYYDAETNSLKEGQPFPCYKLNHKRKSENAVTNTSTTLHRMVVLGDRYDILHAIEQLERHADDDEQLHESLGGVVTKNTYDDYQEQLAVVRDKKKLEKLLKQQSSA
jgi:hypothetical protein